MAGNSAIDLLLVGPELELCAAAAIRDGLSAETVRSSVKAVARVRLVHPRVVVLSGGEIEGRELDAVRAMKEEAGSPSVLLTVPPHRADRPESHLPGEVDDTVREPYLPEQLLVRVRRLLARRAVAESEPTEGFPGGADGLRDLLDDVARLNEQIADLEALKDAILVAFQRRSAARRASFLCVHEDDAGRRSLILERGVGLPPDVKPGTAVPIEGTLSGRVADTAGPLLVTDIAEAPHKEMANQGSYRTRSCLSLPLTANDRVLAVVNLADRSDGQPFNRHDLRVQGIFARHAGQVLANAMSLARMTRLSILDDLTGLYNRRFFRRSLDREFRRAERYDRPLTLAILDIDHFKALNDSNGHEAGNRVLAMIGEILRTSFRNTDIVARYGGEEFAVILPEIEQAEAEEETPPTGVHGVLDRLRLRVAETPFPGGSGQPGGALTISGGAASYPSDAKTVEELLDAADAALYAAKRQGRNRIVLA